MAKSASRRALRKGSAAAADPKAEALRLYGTGRYREALRSASRALKQRPEDPELWNLGGGAALALGLTADAEQFWRVAVARGPACADAHHNLGVLHYARRDLEAAARYFARAVVLSPNHAPALNNLAAVLQHLGRFSEAATLLRRAVTIDPGNTEALNNLGLALIELGRFEEARASLDRALALRPNFAAALTSRARLSSECGEEQAALALLDAALAANPEHGEAYYNRSRLVRAVRGDAWIGPLEHAFARRASLPVKSASALSFAMGKVREDLGEYDAAFEAYAEGNRLCHAQQRFDEDEDERSHTRRSRSFTADLYAQVFPAPPPAPASPALPAVSASRPSPASRTEGSPPAPPPAPAESTGAPLPIEERVPVFVVGMPRSGTSLIEQVLASHPQVCGAGELPLLAELAATLPPAVPPPPEREAWLAQLRALGRDYLARAWSGAGERRCLIDKMPGNYLHLGLLPLMIPGARIIHVQRDALDTCVSCYATPFLRAHEYSFDLGLLGRRYRRYERLMAHWAAVLPPGQILEVRYEALIADLELETRRMLSHLGLAWDEACRSFHENPRVVRTASLAQVRQPLYAGSIGRWRRFERHLDPLREALAGASAEGVTQRTPPPERA